MHDMVRLMASVNNNQAKLSVRKAHSQHFKSILERFQKQQTAVNWVDRRHVKAFGPTGK